MFHFIDLCLNYVFAYHKLVVQVDVNDSGKDAVQIELVAPRIESELQGLRLWNNAFNVPLERKVSSKLRQRNDYCYECMIFYK